MKKYSIVFIIAISFISFHACAPRSYLVTNERASQYATHERFGSKFAIASEGTAAGTAATKMFDLGGNAIDAAVAASFAISVERPHSTGLGGGGFMLIRLASGESVAVDFREKAPQAAHAKLFQDAKGEVIDGLSTEGGLSVGVPGVVAGLLEVHAKYGRLTREQVLAPAIELAEKGFVVYPHLAEAIEKERELLSKSAPAKELFLRGGDAPLKAGDLLVQAQLAATLREISKKGREGFYKGRVAAAILKETRKNNGLMTQKDLDAYEVKFRKPVAGTYREFEILSMPPPSSGGVHVLQILNILEKDDLRNHGPYSATAVHRTASAMRLAFADRAKYLGDRDFVEVPVEGLISKSYAATLRKRIEDRSALKADSVQAGDPMPHESDQTTHFSLIDKEGNAVSSTQTINTQFGSGVYVSDAGVFLNNEMDDFSAKTGSVNVFGVVGGEPNAIEPGKRPLSSMSPTIVLKDDVPVLAVGAPGGPRIITCVTLTLLNYLEYEMPLYDSVASVRYHDQWRPDTLWIENEKFPKDVIGQLNHMGHQAEIKKISCRVQAVANENGRLHGVADPRWDGNVAAR